jgi:AraC family transcriptional regulator
MNKTLFEDQHSNSIRISDFNLFHGETSFNNLAIKYVAKGSESYFVKNKKFLVQEGEFMIGNNDLSSEVKINERTLGLCIDISIDFMTEILNDFTDNIDFKTYILSENFLLNKYNSKNTKLGEDLKNMVPIIFKNQHDVHLSQELFYTLGENLIQDQLKVFSQISKLSYKKKESNQDVFRNLLDSKQFIDDCFLNQIGVDDLLHISHLSKYAFIRLFKTTFGITPYQYILEKRLNYAKNLIIKGEKISETAYLTCFADTPSFSKAFKLHFGTSPTFFSK